VTIARHFGRTPTSKAVGVYAAGGYYYPPGSRKSLTDELRSYQDLGFTAFKMKIGGASLKDDIARIEEAGPRRGRRFPSS
jgi:L-alanine-DL-glutamate epimerase-like enolase superfamily enzyme